MTHAELFEKMKEAARRSTSQLKRLSAESQYQMNCFNLFDIDGKYTVWLNPEPITLTAWRGFYLRIINDKINYDEKINRVGY